MIYQANPDLEAVGVSEVLSVFAYGSLVYGTTRPDSDLDYIIVTKEQPTVEEQQVGSCDFHFFSEADFQDRIAEHELSALECLWVPPTMRWGKEYSTTIDKAKLRKSISAKASNSWVKAKKKLEVEQEYLIGRKSLFHSFRILLFGIQLAKFGKIVDYTDGRRFFHEIVLSGHNDWDFFNKHYKPTHNMIASEFRKFAPK